MPVCVPELRISMFDHEKLDVYTAAIEENLYRQARQLLLRIVSMLIKMAQITEKVATTNS